MSEGEEVNKQARFSDVSDVSGSDYDEAGNTDKTSTAQKEKRKSSNGFDEYTFVNPIIEDDEEEARKKAEEDAEKEAERFIQLARLKNTEYSKMDVVKMASALRGLNLDEHLVDPVPIPGSPYERGTAVKAIYGSEADAESEPYQDPVKSLETESELDQERVRSPPNLYEALQSNFLKSNYKTNLYRLILMGTHDENLSHFIEWNKEIVDFINVQSYTEQINGVLCVYEYYFIHVLEGSEDNLIRLLQRYAKDLDPSGYEWDLKFHYRTGKYTGREHQKFHTVQSWVLGIFKIYERQLTTWRGEKVFPNRMHITDIQPGGFREKYFQFIKQIMIMAFTYNRMAPGTFNPSSENQEEISSHMKKTIERAKIQRFKTLGKVVPPITLLQYVLDHKDNPKLKIRTVREHLDLFGGTPAYISSANTEWPPPGRIAPYD